MPATSPLVLATTPYTAAKEHYKTSKALCGESILGPEFTTLQYQITKRANLK